MADLAHEALVVAGQAGRGEYEEVEGARTVAAAIPYEEGQPKLRRQESPRAGRQLHPKQASVSTDNNRRQRPEHRIQQAAISRLDCHAQHMKLQGEMTTSVQATSGTKAAQSTSHLQYNICN